jgi:hypothetical protein
VSTREEILATLKANPDGMTSKELAPHCPACECDEMVVGRNIAHLHADNLIRPGTQLRKGATVWLHGGKVQEVREAPITLASGGVQGGAQTPSAAAQAIAEMRAGSTRTYTHSSGKKTVREQIEAALRQHGPMTSAEIGKAIGNDDARQHCSALTQRRIILKIGGGLKSSIFGLPGQTLADRKITSQPVTAAPVKTVTFDGKPPPADTLVENVKAPEKDRGAAAQSGDRDVVWGAEAPAAGPALGGALRELEEKRAKLDREQADLLKEAEAIGAQISKISRAIEALGALA